MDKVESIVLGAGVVGLAVARALALRGHEPIILDAGSIIGSGTSSRNSEVVHAGIYYPKVSLKAAACVEGKARLYQLCEERGVPYRVCGKLIITASSDQEADLAELKRKAAANGVDDLIELSRAKAIALEPQLTCTAALLSLSSGIVDSHGFMLALQGDAETHGAITLLNTSVQSARADANGFLLTLSGGDHIRTRLLVNALGLNACQFAHDMGAPFSATAPTPYFAKGNYFALNTKAPFSRLVYPMPEPGGLGVHITIDLNGRARFGPDVEWIDKLDYDVDPKRADVFYGRVRAYWPGLPDGSLVPDYSGIRPKITAPGEAAADFRIDGPQVHGVPGIVHMFGIESPGLTASMSLADVVADQISDRPRPAGSI